MPTLRDTISGLVFMRHGQYSFQHSCFEYHPLHSWPVIALFASFVMDRLEFKWNNDFTVLVKAFRFKRWHEPWTFLQKRALKCQKRPKQVQILPVLFEFKFYPSLQFHTISHNFTCSNQPPKNKVYPHFTKLPLSSFANQLSCVMSKFESFLGNLICANSVPASN